MQVAQIRASLIIVIPPAPGTSYICNKCGRSFANEVDLKSHSCPGPHKDSQIQMSAGIG